MLEEHRHKHHGEIVQRGFGEKPAGQNEAEKPGQLKRRKQDRAQREVYYPDKD